MSLHHGETGEAVNWAEKVSRAERGKEATNVTNKWDRRSVVVQRTALDVGESETRVVSKTRM